MKKISVLIDFQFTMQSLIILCVLLTPIFIYAGTFYRCTDNNGNEILTDHPSAGKDCKPIMTFKGMTDKERMDYEKEKDEKSKAEYKKMRVEDEKSKAEENVKKNLDECYQRASKRYDDAYAGTCTSLTGNPYCKLPSERAQPLIDNLEKDRKQCLNSYPQKPNP
jgi:hypothetical protein